MSELLTIEEVAKILNVSPDTATRRFTKVTGVIDIGSPETPKKRRYRVLRVPKTVLEKYLLKRGGPVDIKTPERTAKLKQKVVKIPPTEDELARQLATIAKVSGTNAQQTLDRIAERAAVVFRVSQLIFPVRFSNRRARTLKPCGRFRF